MLVWLQWYSRASNAAALTSSSPVVDASFSPFQQLIFLSSLFLLLAKNGAGSFGGREGEKGGRKGRKAQVITFVCERERERLFLQRGEERNLNEIMFQGKLDRGPL